MISPSYSLTATERVLPRLSLDFTTALLDSRVTFTRAGNTATVTNSSGVIVGINADLPRFDFNPTTLVCNGLLIEEARTNALLNSLIDGTDLATQLVTVTAAARTFSFYGTGTVVLSGAHSATVVGVGAYPARTILTFTPSAGVLTLTVTGTVQFAQLEAGAKETSFIPTEAAAVTRNADVATMTGTNFSDWFIPTEGTFEFRGATGAPTSSFPVALQISDGTFANRITMGYFNFNNFQVIVTSVVQCGITTATPSTNVQTTTTAAYKLDNFGASTNASNTATDTSGTVPTVNQLRLGATLTGAQVFNGSIQRFFYYPQRLTNAEIQAFAKG